MANVGVHSYSISTKRASVSYGFVKIVFFFTCEDVIAGLNSSSCEGSIVQPVQPGTHQSLVHFSCQWYTWNCGYLYFDWCWHHRLRDNSRRHAGCKERRLCWTWKFGTLVYCDLYVDLPFYGASNFKLKTSESSSRQVLKEIPRATFLSLAICALSKVQGSTSQAHWQLEHLLSFLLWLHLVILRLRSSKSLP